MARLWQPRFKRPHDIASPRVCKARGVSTSALPHCVFPPPTSQSSPSEPERRRSLSSHASSVACVNRRCPDGSRPSPSPVLSVFCPRRWAAVPFLPGGFHSIFTVWTQQGCFVGLGLRLATTRSSKSLFWFLLGDSGSVVAKIEFRQQKQSELVSTGAFLPFPVIAAPSRGSTLTWNSGFRKPGATLGRLEGTTHRGSVCVWGGEKRGRRGVNGLVITEGEK